MLAHEIIDEIGTLPRSSYSGYRSLMWTDPPPGRLRPLPGSDQLLYGVERFGVEAKITVWRRGQVESGDAVGVLSLDSPGSGLPVPRASEVSYIAVASAYRGQGVAQSMYQIALRDMRRTLIAGEDQTPAGQRAWVTLWRTPGVEVRGWLQIQDFHIMDEPGARVIDPLMGEIGADYIGQMRVGRDHFRYFSFEVQSMDSGKRMEAAVQNRLNRLYGHSHRNGVEDAGMYAVWRG